MAAMAPPRAVHALVVLQNGLVPDRTGARAAVLDGLWRDGALHPLSPTERILLEHLPLTVGRVPPADLVLGDITVSRRHCRFSHAGAHVMLHDLGSTNGTYVNGTPVGEAGSVLQDGALIQVAGRTLRYERRSRAELAAEAALDRDLQEASDYVAAILPPPMTTGPVQAAWFFRPSARLSGDAFGYRWLDADWFTFFLVDAAGHGTAAALHAVSLANALRQQMLPGVDLRAPDDVLRGLNRLFPMERHDDRFATIWYGAYERSTRRLAFASGGHHPAYLIGPGAAPLPLVTRNPAIGMAPDRAMRMEVREVPPGSALHLFSDGAFDLPLIGGGILDLAALTDLLPAAATPQALYDAILRRVGPAAIEDDLSTLVVRFP